MIKKNFDSPDEQAKPAEKIAMDQIEVDGKTFYRVTAAPGWKWSVDLKPVVKTDTCQMDHLLYVVSGRMVVKMDAGEELECGSGDVVHIPPGHDGWGLGDQPTVWLEIPR